MTSSNSGPSGRSPFPAARNPRSRSNRNSVESSYSGEESHSPFLSNLLRYSPKNSNVHLSPLNPNRGRDSITNAGQRPRTRFFDPNKSTNNENENLCKPPVLVDGIPVDQLRTMSKNLLVSNPTTAEFYAGMLYAKTDRSEDALLLAQAHALTQKYTAALKIIDEAGLSQHWDAILISCQALASSQEWGNLIELLEDVCKLPDTNAGTPTFPSLGGSPPLEDNDQIGWLSLKRSISTTSYTNIHPLSMVCWYRGRAYFETSCGIRATTFWKLSLKMDCQNQQAWENLTAKNLLAPGEAYQLISDLEFRENQEWLRSLYLSQIELTPQEPISEDTSMISVAMQGTSLDASSIHFSSPIPSFPTPGALLNQLNENDEKPKTVPPLQKEVDSAYHDLWSKHKLQDAPKVLAMAARRSYRRYDWKAALNYCEKLAQTDPTVEEAAFCYVSTLVILGHKRALFRLAHEWVDASPKAARSWFAVGAYYYCIERYHLAQRHFCRATRLDPQCTEAWIAFGCSFAACDETDQALASFRASQRMSPGDHSSLMYMGMEYVRTNHLVLAGYFLNSALSVSGGDPLCLHELGVLWAHKDEHKEAIGYFCRALTSIFDCSNMQDCINMCQDVYWEPTIFNLGHSLRKLCRYEEATSCYRRCATLCPDKFSTYSALAFTNQLMGNLDKAIAEYHQALSLKPDDNFSTEMLRRALQDQIASQDIFDLPVSKTKPVSRSLVLSPVAAGREEESMDMDESDIDMSQGS